MFRPRKRSAQRPPHRASLGHRFGRRREGVGPMSQGPPLCSPPNRMPLLPRAAKARTETLHGQTAKFHPERRRGASTVRWCATPYTAIRESGGRDSATVRRPLGCPKRICLSSPKREVARLALGYSRDSSDRYRDEFFEWRRLVGRNRIALKFQYSDCRGCSPFYSNTGRWRGETTWSRSKSCHHNRLKPARRAG